jgi:hypothetical protein
MLSLVELRHPLFLPSKVSASSSWGFRLRLGLKLSTFLVLQLADINHETSPSPAEVEAIPALDLLISCLIGSISQKNSNTSLTYDFRIFFIYI